jgi:hypothetical protein
MAPQHRSRKGRASPRPLRKIETVENTEIDELVDESLIEPFQRVILRRGQRWPASALLSSKGSRLAFEKQDLLDK